MLFKKLNEEIETEKVIKTVNKGTDIDDTEKAKVEKDLIFGNALTDIENQIRVVENNPLFSKEQKIDLDK